MRIHKSHLTGALVLSAMVSSALADTSLRVAHLSPDAPAVDVYLDGSMVLEDVGYPAFSPYLDIMSGMHEVQVFVSGTTSNPVIDADLNFEDGSATTVAATGLLGDGSFGPIVLEDSRDSNHEEAWVRFVHTAADAPAVDITLNDGSVLFGDVAFNESADWLPVAGGSYGLQVRLAGTSTVVLDFNAIELMGMYNYSVFATGTLADGSLGAYATVDAPGDGSQMLMLEPVTTYLRVAHLSPDAPAVDVYLDGSMVLEDVGYPAFSPYLDIMSGMHEVQVFVSGTTSNPVIDADLNFEDGSATTVAATGLLGDGSFGPIVLEDSRDSNHEEAWVRFVHTAADAPAVDITLNDGSVLFGDIAFNESADWLPVAGGSYGLQVRLAGTSTVVLDFNAIELMGMYNYSVFATGTLADGSLGAYATVDAPGDGSQMLMLELNTSVENEARLPGQFELLPAYPNPFNPSTQLSFELREAAPVRLAIYNLGGQLVSELVNGVLPGGRHTAQWNAVQASSGVYLALLESAQNKSVQRLTLLK